MTDDKALTVYGVSQTAVEALTKDRNPVASYLTSAAFKSEVSRKTRLDALRVFVALLALPKDGPTEGVRLKVPDPTVVYNLDWSALRPEDFRLVMGRLQRYTFRMERPKGSDHFTVQTYSERSAAKILGSARSLIAFMLDQGLTASKVNAEGILGIRLPRVNLNTAARYASRHVEQAEISKMLTVCRKEGGPVGARDAALLALAFSTGRRTQELLALRLADVRIGRLEDFGVLLPDMKGHIGVIRLRIAKGKSSDASASLKDEVALANGALDILEAWLAIRGKAPGYLFPKCSRGGSVFPDTSMSRQAFGQVILKRCRQAHVPVFTPHDCRRTYAATAGPLDNKAAMTMGGWAQPTMMMHYDRRGSLRGAVGLALRMSLPVPTPSGKGKPKKAKASGRKKVEGARRKQNG